MRWKRWVPVVTWLAIAYAAALAWALAAGRSVDGTVALIGGMMVAIAWTLRGLSSPPLTSRRRDHR